MKCSKCGTQNNDNSRFCSNCGEKLISESILKTNDNAHNLQAINYETSTGNVSVRTDLSGVKDISDNELINQLNRAQIVLNEAYYYLNEAAAIQRNISLNKYEVDVKKYIRIVVIECIKLLVVTIILTSLIDVSGMFLLEIIVFILGFGIPAYIIYKVYSLFKMYFRDKEQIVNTQRYRANELNAKGTAILRSNTDLLNVVPENYWMPEAVKNIMGSLRVGRAKDLKEALDICDQYLIKVSNDQIRNQLQAGEIEMVNQLQIIQGLQIAGFFMYRF